MSKTITSNILVTHLLNALGNTEPTPVHMKLAHTLLLKSYFQYDQVFHTKLSQTEQACLWLAAHGETIKSSAHRLGCKSSTVNTFRKRILAKLKCKTMAQAVFMGIQYHYLPPTMAQRYDVMRGQVSEMMKDTEETSEVS